MENYDIIREILLISNFRTINDLICVSSSWNRIVEKILNDNLFCKEYLGIHFNITSFIDRDWVDIMRILKGLIRREVDDYTIIDNNVVCYNDEYLVLEDIIEKKAYDALEVVLGSGIFGELNSFVLNTIVNVNDIRIAEIIKDYVTCTANYWDCLNKGNVRPEVLKIMLDCFEEQLEQGVINILSEKYESRGNYASADIIRNWI